MDVVDGDGVGSGSGPWILLWLGFWEGVRGDRFTVEAEGKSEIQCYCEVLVLSMVTMWDEVQGPGLGLALGVH